jgi:hypothetical protein
MGGVKDAGTSLLFVKISDRQGKLPLKVLKKRVVRGVAK